MTSASVEPGIIIRAGRIVCPVSGIDGPGSVVIRGTQIESVVLASASSCTTFIEPTDSDRVLEFPDGTLLPGLVDLHAHPSLESGNKNEVAGVEPASPQTNSLGARCARPPATHETSQQHSMNRAKAGSVFGVHPDRHMLARGVTTVMSQGDAGADGIDDYVEETIRNSRMKVVLAINLSRIGESTNSGCFESLDDADVKACVDAIARHRKHVKAVAINTSHHACGGTDPREVLQRGILAAEETGLPILYGMRRPEDWPLDRQLALLRAGDIVTYCFRREPHCIVQNGRVIDCVTDARQRGILFDIGHGMGSFSFDVAEAAIGDGFLPDTISTDLQRQHIDAELPHDLTLTMSKLRAAGMAEADIFRAVTTTPARVLGINEVSGAIAPGRRADLVVLKSSPNQCLQDVYMQTRHGVMWTPCRVVCGGTLVDVRNQQCPDHRELK